MWSICLGVHSSGVRIRLFFFTAPCVHRGLHSFPTRRSSDLMRSGSVQSTVTPAAGRSGASADLFALADRRAAGIEMEEHTSELQSQFHLVCRLLLEKKKKNFYKQRPGAHFQEPHGSAVSFY